MQRATKHSTTRRNSQHKSQNNSTPSKKRHLSSKRTFHSSFSTQLSNHNSFTRFPFYNPIPLSTSQSTLPSFNTITITKKHHSTLKKYKNNVFALKKNTFTHTLPITSTTTPQPTLGNSPHSPSLLLTPLNTFTTIIGSTIPSTNQINPGLFMIDNISQSSSSSSSSRLHIAISHPKRHLSTTPHPLNNTNSTTTSPQQFNHPISPLNDPKTRKIMTDLSEFICIDAFCARQFTKGCESGFINYDSQEFLTKVQELINARLANGEDLAKDVLVEGYAPFCKHIFVENFTDSTPTAIPITPQISPLIKTAYVARTEHELAVLSRFVESKDIPEGVVVQPAKYLDLILYSREQIILENEAMGTTNNDSAKWGIISVKAQDQPFETPMQPITMMRNALGKDQGGSGVTLEREKYKASVEFWDKNVSLV